MFAASSACAARFSIYVLLSFLTLCLPPPDVTPEINRADEELKINLNLP
jgi:hypothetical protein